MLKRKKKTILLCIVMVIVLLIGGLAAYFTDSETKTNVFTVGNVDIEITEPHWNGDYEGILPNEHVPKDPQITNTGNNPAYIFATVTVPLTLSHFYNDDGTKMAYGYYDMFSFNLNDGWEVIDEFYHYDDNYKYYTYVVAYKDGDNLAEVMPNNTTNSIFDEVIFENVDKQARYAENTLPPDRYTGYYNKEIPKTRQDVIINGFAIQSNNLDKDSIEDIWDIIKPYENDPDTGEVENIDAGFPYNVSGGNNNTNNDNENNNDDNSDDEPIIIDF